jgi:hypothetical protein
MPRDFEKKLKMKWDDIKIGVWGDLTATARKDERNVNMFTNMHRPLAEGDFCDDHGNNLQSVLVQDYTDT